MAKHVKHKQSSNAINDTTLLVGGMCLILLIFIGFMAIQTPTQSKFSSPGASDSSSAQSVQSQKTPKQQCEESGSIWCNGVCYNSCPSGQRANCPTTGALTCVITRNIEEMKKNIVYIKQDVTGCCDSLGQISTQLGGSGSGVIYYKNSTTVSILTSRHVVDCVFSGSCNYPTSEKITVRTQNGKFYTPNHVWYAPKNLDLAILDFQATDGTITEALLNSENYSIGDKVIAIGYPAVLQSAEPVLEFSTTEGNINNIHNLLTYQGLSFTAIQSDALVDHGSSGGGLFDKDGNLIGLVTWGDREQKIAIAIGTNVLSDIDNAQEKFVGCPSGTYQLIDAGCCQYGTIFGTDGTCHQPCGKPTSYCPPSTTCLNGQCYGQCQSGYVLGTDGICHPKCGEGYCSEGTCYNNQCVGCSSGQILGSDGKCHQPCGTSTTYCSDNSVCFNNQCVSCPSGSYLGIDGNCHPY